MFYNLPTPQLIFILVGTACLYLLILGIVYGRKLITAWRSGQFLPAFRLSAAVQPAANAWPKSDSFPPLIDKPADHPSEQAGLYQTAPDDPHFEMVEDDGFTTLLKEAERVVEQIKDTINNIATLPANPEEVFTKIRAIVSEYRIFLETEYYDAINSFIAVTVQRECELSWTAEDLTALWYAEAV